MRPKLTPPTDEEEAAIQRGIAQDTDMPEWTEEDFKRARPAREVMAPALYNGLIKAQQKRGPGKKPAKVLVTFRLEPEVVERLRASGPGWQVRAADALRALSATMPIPE